jgi:hypothetical protein
VAAAPAAAGSPVVDLGRGAEGGTLPVAEGAVGPFGPYARAVVLADQQLRGGSRSTGGGTLRVDKGGGGARSHD